MDSSFISFLTHIDETEAKKVACKKGAWYFFQLEGIEEAASVWEKVWIFCD